jgi:Caudovirus prohead serine protease
MSEHRVIRCDAGPLGAREEVMPDFEGRSELEHAIIEARDRGDDDELHRLQSEYRHARRGITRTRDQGDQGDPTPAGSATVAKPDDARELTGYVATWNCLHRVALDGTGGPCFVRASRHCFDQWLRSLDLIDTPVPLMVDHKLGPVGTWVAFAVDSRGLKGTALVKDEPAGHILLDAADAGDLFFSCHWEPVDSREVGTLRGAPVFELTAAAITEASATTHPADADCTVITVRGRRPDFHRIEDARRRHRQLQELARTEHPGPRWDKAPRWGR